MKAGISDPSLPGALGLVTGQHASGSRGAALCGPQDRLRRRVLDRDERAAVWWLGVHGGAGESTLEELFAGSRAADHCWPVAADDRAPARVVLVARTHARGLAAADAVVRVWESEDLRVLLCGLVLMAAAPGRLPAKLKAQADRIAERVPVVWRVPWVEVWRVGESPGAHNAPRVLHRLRHDLRALSGAEEVS